MAGQTIFIKIPSYPAKMNINKAGKLYSLQQRLDLSLQAGTTLYLVNQQPLRSEKAVILVHRGPNSPAQ